MPEPIVSVVIPLFNRKDFIQRTIQSLIGQTYGHWEAVVVDDGSTDGSDDVVAQLSSQDSRVKLFKRERLPKNASTCRNIGVEKAVGKYVIFLDSDDLLAPYCLERRVVRMEKNPELDFVVFNMMLFKETLDDTHILWNVPGQADALYRFLKLDGVWSITGPMYKRSFLNTSGGFDENLRFWQDYEFHVRLLISQPSFQLYLDAKPDSYNRRHTFESISQKGLRSTSDLSFKEKTYYDLVRLLKDNRGIEGYKIAVVSTFFYQAEQWVILFQDKQAAFNSWAKSKKVTGTWTYFFGKASLFFEFHFYRSEKNIYKVFYKLLRLMLHAEIRNRSTTMCKVKYEG